MIKIDLYQLNRKMKLYPVVNYIKIHHREYELNCKQEKKYHLKFYYLKKQIFQCFFLISAKTSSPAIPTSNVAQSWRPPWHAPEGVVPAGYAAVSTASTCAPSRPTRPRPATLSASNDAVSYRTRHQNPESPFDGSGTF